MKHQLLIYTFKSNSESRIKGSYYCKTEITFNYKTKKQLKENKNSKNMYGYSVTSILTWSQAKKAFTAKYLNRLLKENEQKLKREIQEIGKENITIK